MAKQSGIIKITGTINGICFYKLHGEHYARLKSSLNGKRIKTDKVFQNTMKYAALLAEASKVGSVVYHLLPKEKRERKVYQQLTGKAMQLLKKGLTNENVIAQLRVRFYTLQTTELRYSYGWWKTNTNRGVLLSGNTCKGGRTVCH